MKNMMFQLLKNKFGTKRMINAGEMKDSELIDFIQSKEGKTAIKRAIIRMENRVDKLNKELRQLHLTWFKNRELANQAHITPVERGVIYKKIAHLEEQIHVLEGEVITEMLEDIKLLKMLLLDTIRIRRIIEEGDKMTDRERIVILKALKGTY